MAGLVMLPSGSATAEPADESEGLARIIGADLLGGDLARVGTAASGNPTAPGPEQAPIDATVLGQLLSVQLPGLSIPLIGDGSNDGLLDLGAAADAGLLDSYSSSPTTSSSVATSGAVGADGAIDAGATRDPSTIGAARLDLTSLLGQLGLSGITDDVVDELSVELGAMASRAAQDGTGAADRTYGLAGGRLTVHSPAVAQLSTSLQRTLANTETALNAAIGSSGAIGRALAGVRINVPVGLAGVTAGPASASVDVDLDGVTQSLLAEPLTSTNGFVTIDLADGTISVDLAKVVKNSPTATDLNGLDPNTEVLSPAVIQRISDGVGDALGDLGAAAGTAVTRALNGADLTVKLPGNVALLGANTPLDITIDGSLGDFAGTSTTQPDVDIQVGGALGSLLTPVLNALNPLLDGVIANVIRPVVGTTVNTLTTGVAPAVNGLTSTALTALDPLFEQVLPNVATLTINEQTEDDPNELTNETGSSTVRALAIDLLPNLAGGPLAEVNLAASTVRVGNAEEAPTLTASPESVRAGDTISTAGEGWPPNTEVELTYTDSDGEVVGTTTVTTTADGGLTDSFVVPPGTAVGTLTVGATDPGGRTASDTVEVLDTPTLDASPASVPQGGTVTTEGEGWPPNSEVQLTYRDSNGVVVAGPRPVPTDANGALTDSLLLPPGTAPGTLTITGTGPGGATATDTVQVEAAPVIVAGPAEVREGDTVSVSSSGWPANTPVTLTYRDDTGAEIGTSTITTNDAGALTDSFQVPDGTPLGDLTVTGTSEGGRTATAGVQVVADPAVTSTPGVVRPGDTVTSELTGFPPSTDVTVTYTDANGGVVATQTVTTDADGAVTDTLVVPSGTPAGTLTIAADDGAGNAAQDTVNVAPAPAGPSVTAGPDPVQPGETVSVVGDGYPPNTEVTVTYTDADGTVIDTNTVTTDGDGGFTDSVVVPDGTPVGDLTVDADDGDGNDAQDTVSVTAAPADPSLTAGPDPVSPGDRITAIGGDFPPISQLTVTYTDSAGTVIGTQTVTTDGTGGFTDSLVVPAGTPAGQLTVRADDGAGNTAQDTVTVTAPALDPSVTAGPDPVQPGETVSVVGDGYPPNTEVTVTYTDADGTVIDTSTVTTDGDGGFTDSVVVPEGTPVGDLTVQADDGDGNTAQDTVSVTAAPANPSVTAGPDPVSPGDRVTAIGGDFPANTDVTVTYTDADGNVIDTNTVTTDGTGGFTDSLVVPAGTPLGELTISADDGDGNTAQDTVTVAAPAGDPVITAGPDPVEPGETVTVIGGGFPPNTEVTVTYTDPEGEVIDTNTVTTDDDGEFTDSTVVPEGTPPGDLTVNADDGDGTTADDTVTVAASPAADPSVTAGPDPVRVGDTISTVGGGYPPNTELTVTYTDADGEVVATNDVTTDDNGAFTDSLVVPEGTALGELTVRADDGDGTAAEDTLTVAPPAFSPTLDAQPAQAAYGDRIDVVSGDWPPNSAIQLSYTDADGEVVATKTVTTNDQGAFTDSLTVPAGTALGDLTVRATGGNALAATDTVEIQADPVVESGPGVVDPGDTVTTELTGYPPNTDVTVTYTDAENEVIETRTVTTDDEGSATDTFEVPDGTPAGPLTITADAGDGVTGSDTVTVAQPDPEEPTVTVGPDPVSPGETVTVDGGGFPPNTEVTVTYTDDDGEVIDEHTVTTDDDGGVDDSLVLPPDTPPGDLTVEIDDGNGTTATDTTTVEAVDAAPAIESGPGVVAPGGTVTSNITGFPPNAVISITYVDSDGDTIGTDLVTADANGAVANETFQVPADTPGGALTVRATDLAGNTASDTVNVAVDTDDPSITAGPPTVEPGEEVTVSGTEFPPNTEVTITPTDSDGNDLPPVTVQTDENGDFTDSFVVPNGTATGPLTITADDGDGASSTVAIQVVSVSDDDSGVEGEDESDDGNGNGDGSGVAGADADADGLPDTGAPAGLQLVLMSLLLVIAGTTVVVRSRRVTGDD